VKPPRIKLSGYLDIPSESWDKILEALEIHIALTRAEAGCIYFNVDPSKDIPFRLNVSEMFVDQAAFDAHQARNKPSDWAKKSAGIPRHFEISEDHG
jgi:quinol monooxygenase YgiN